MAALVLVCSTADAQGFLGRLEQRARNAAERKVGDKLEQDIEDAIDGRPSRNRNNRDDDEDEPRSKSKNKKSDTWTCPECGTEGNTGKFCNECGAKKPAEDDGTWTCPECGTEGNTGKFCNECGAKKPGGAPKTTSEAVKSDFVRGSVVLFQDDFKNEQIGEFPSKWDIQGEGNAETAVVNGQKFLNYTTGWNMVEPLMENMKSYLPDVFTIEYDIFYSKNEDGQSDMEIIFDKGEDDRVGLISVTFRTGDDAWAYYTFEKPGGGNVNGSFDGDQIRPLIKKGQWNHFAVSFNKRALKFYVNDVRVVNLPNVDAPERFKFWGNGDYKYRGFANVLLCAGAKELYERETTNLSEAARAVEQAIAQTGKFVTNNILFDTGKATIKPESQAEIDRIAEYMKANPTVRFEVQGHTDNQGSDAVNDPLSQQRAEAVVKALESLGVDGFNLRAVGKGSHEPVADNKTEEGRAKNRRVEFVKK